MAWKNLMTDEEIVRETLEIRGAASDLVEAALIALDRILKKLDETEWALVNITETLDQWEEGTVPQSPGNPSGYTSSRQR